MKKIVACLILAALVMGLLDVLSLSPDQRDDTILSVDAAENAALMNDEALYEELFAPGSLVEINIGISREQLACIQRDFEKYNIIGTKGTVYRIADNVTLSVNGKTYAIGDVGLRMKGSSSRCSFYNDVLGIYNLINFRMSFTQTFDDAAEYELNTKAWPSEEARRARQERRFATLKGLELKWNTGGDNTYVRAGYVNEVYRAYGLPVQKSNLATVSIGGIRLGVYRIYEPVNEDFIHRYFPQEDWGGDLYKVRCIGRSAANYQANNSYGINRKQKGTNNNFDLKTNKDTCEHQSIRHLLEVINSPGVTREEIDAVADTDELTRMAAVGFALGNQDDIRSNYNNHYIYFRASDGKAVFIPYDSEVVMGDIFSWNPPGEGMTALSPYYVYNDKYGKDQENPLMRQIVIPGGYYTDAYSGYLLELAGSPWMEEETFRRYYETFAAVYRDKTVPSYYYMSTMSMNTSFSMEGGADCNGNLSVPEFLEKMKRNILQNTVIGEAPEEN